MFSPSAPLLLFMPDLYPGNERYDMENARKQQKKQKAVPDRAKSCLQNNL
jgi:hypothetical protein